MKKHNFYAGPAILPQSVMQQAAEAAKELDGMGLSLLEISHRSKEFKAILEEAQSLVKQLLNIGDSHEVLYLSGGASSQFYMVPMNLLDEDDTACYVNSGRWSDNAIKEAKIFGKVHVSASSKEEGYTSIPTDLDIPEGAKYLHITSNNTVNGTQYREFPNVDLPIVADMSSDIFSRELDISKFGVIYAGAQKNLGPAGTTLVIVRKDLVGKVKRAIPTMLDYGTHIKKSSAYNTPPVFPIYVAMLNLRWIIEKGGLDAMEARNKAKADLLYGEIDSNPLFKGTCVEADRSWMNVTFVLNDDSLQDAFLADCAAAGCIGVKGHRSVGGFRASMYNAMEIDSVQVLVDVMKKFAEKHA